MNNISCLDVSLISTFILETAETKTLQKLSSGLFVIRHNFPTPGTRSFLLLKLPSRFDIPKGASIKRYGKIFKTV